MPLNIVGGSVAWTALATLQTLIALHVVVGQRTHGDRGSRLEGSERDAVLDAVEEHDDIVRAGDGIGAFQGCFSLKADVGALHPP